jgi:diguanylate cyclase (GGDEF)-like protein/PAS domain S-box-containing protein
MRKHISDIMTRHLDSLSSASTLADAALLMSGSRISSVLVIDDDQLLGIITERDMVKAMNADMPPETGVAALMTPGVLTVRRDVELAAAFRLASRHGVRHLAVVDINGRPIGMVSESDFRFHLGIGFFAHLRDVSSLMGQNWLQATPDAPLSESLESMVESRASCVIVTQENIPLGIITERDVVRLYSEQKQGVSVGSVMTAPVRTIRSDAALTQAAAQMQMFGLRHLIVVDDQGRLAGLLSEHDMVNPLEWMDEGTGHAMAADTQERLRQLMNTIPDMVFIKDRHGRYEDCNEAFARCVGRPIEEIIGKTDYDLAPLERADYFRTRDQEVIAASGTICNEEWVTHHDGRHLLMEACKSPVFDHDGLCIGVVAVVRDISERKLAEKQLRLAASVFQFAHDGIYITDADGVILEINRAFEEITGYHRNDVVGKRADVLSSGKHPPEFFAVMKEDLQHHGYWSGEIWNRRKDGELVAELLTISAVRNEAGAATHYVGVFTDITALKQSQNQMERLAYYDALTQLPNRSLFTDRFRIALAQSERSGELLAVGYLDLDGFKPVNDKFGHAVGDQLLQEVARRMDRCVRSGDTASRIGGDEFALLITGLRSEEESEQAVARLLAALSEPYVLEEHHLHITASLGYTLFPYDDGDADALLRHADQAMYTAKHAGRNRYVRFDSEHDRRTMEQQDLLQRIGSGLAAGEFELYYQPKVDMRQQRVVGVEALIRWNHPERGLLLPYDFLPLTENMDLTVDIGNWVLNEALNQGVEWRREGLSLPVSVNISPRHLQDTNFVSHLRSLFERYPDLDENHLELEILESTAFEDVSLVSAVIRECADMGVTFALDDFGTGYSTLIYLRHLPAQVLKIDQTFVRDMVHDLESFAIVESVLGLAAAFKRQAVAEGVETREQTELLRQLGCDVLQGYGVAEPMPADRIMDWVANWNPDRCCCGEAC